MKGGISVVVDYPRGQPGALAVLIPGYLDSKDYHGLRALAEGLCSDGYAVVRFDPTGTWGSAGRIEDYTVTRVLEDVRTVIDYMVKGRLMPVLVAGHSMGGTEAILYAAKDKRVVDVMAIMPSNRLAERRGWARTGVRVSERDLPRRHGTRMFRVPESYIDDKSRYDLLGAVKQVKVPIVFIAGADDTVCPPKEVEEIYNSANDPKYFAVLPGVDHDYRLDVNEAVKVSEQILHHSLAFELLRNARGQSPVELVRDLYFMMWHSFPDVQLEDVVKSFKAKDDIAGTREALSYLVTYFKDYQSDANVIADVMAIILATQSEPAAGPGRLQYRAAKRMVEAIRMAPDIAPLKNASKLLGRSFKAGVYDRGIEELVHFADNAEAYLTKVSKQVGPLVSTELGAPPPIER